MDFAIREWLTVIIILLIVAVILDGLRRVRQARRNGIKMSLSMHQGTTKDDLDVYGSELPNGGARVVGQRDANKAGEVNTTVRKSSERKHFKSSRPRPQPEQQSLNLDESVPMLMDSVAEEPSTHTVSPDDIEDVLLADSSGRREPTFSEYVEDDSDEVDSDRGADATLGEEALDFNDEPDYDTASDADDTVDDEVDDEGYDEVYEEDYPEESYSEEDYADDQAEIDAAAEAEESATEQPVMDPEEVLVINVMAKPGTQFRGAALLEELLACGMRFGAMNIFHRHLEEDGSGPILFSLANIVKPGIFDLASMDDFYTPGVSLFMTLPIDAESLAAFDIMAGAAQALASNLGGELKDDSRSVLTQQTLAHYRQRIKDFERRRLSMA